MADGNDLNCPVARTASFALAPLIKAMRDRGQKYG